MTLFDDKEPCMAGTNGRKDFDLPDTDVLLIANSFTEEQSNYYNKAFMNNTDMWKYEIQ